MLIFFFKTNRDEVKHERNELAGQNVALRFKVINFWVDFWEKEVLK